MVRPSIDTGTHDENFFIIFVDAIFTTSFERLFTNGFDRRAQIASNPCVYRARITD